MYVRLAIGQIASPCHTPMFLRKLIFAVLFPVVIYGTAFFVILGT